MLKQNRIKEMKKSQGASAQITCAVTAVSAGLRTVSPFHLE